MGVKLEISGNYLKWTNGSGNPARYPYRQIRFYANDANEYIELFTKDLNGRLTSRIPFEDEASEGSVTIDTTSPTEASGTVVMASAVAVELASGTVQFNTALANVFSTATAQCTSVVGLDFASGTVICASAIEGDTVIANGLVYTAVNGAKADNTEFSVDTGDTETGTDLADSITNDSRSGDVDDITAVSVTGTVTITSTVRGTGGNAIPLSSSDGTRLAVSGAVLSGGTDGDTVTINGLVYTAVVGVKADNTEFSADTGDNECAADLEDSITNDVRSGTLGIVSASATTDTVTLTSDQAGTGGDVITLAETGTTITISGAVFSGGVDADIVSINGLDYTAVAGVKSDNTEFSIDTSNDAAATDLTDSINNDVRVGTLDDLTASALTDTVTVTQTVGGAAGNATTLTSTGGARVVLSGAVFTGGVTADTVECNGLTYTAVAGAKSDNTEFSIDTSNDAAATDLADAITNDARAGVLNDTTATANTDTVTITTSVGGVVGNATTLSSSDGTRLAVSAANLENGADDAEITMISVNSVDIMSSAESNDGDINALAALVAANITAHTSVPNYTAVAVDELITITPDDEDTDVNGYVVTATVSNATATEVDMAGATASILTSAGVPFASWTVLIDWLEDNTGGDLIT